MWSQVDRLREMVPSKPSLLFSTKMKLVPFILSQKQVNQFTVSQIQVFLAYAGKSVWKTEESGSVSLKTILQDYCEPNGLTVQKTYVDKQNQIAYLMIDPTKTTLTDFYTWEEALAHQTKPECWRRFSFIQDSDQADWWSPQGLVEAEIQDFGNVTNLFHIIQEYF
jgi:hypothetical protein